MFLYKRIKMGANKDKSLVFSHKWNEVETCPILDGVTNETLEVLVQWPYLNEKSLKIESIKKASAQSGLGSKDGGWGKILPIQFMFI